MFHIRNLQKILRVTWQDKIPHNDILHRTNCESIESTLTRRTLRWVGHVIRMPEERLPKQVLYSELAEGARLAGGQKKRFKDHIKKTLKECNIDPTRLEDLAVDRTTYRSTIKQGVQHLETERRSRRDRKRATRHQRHQQPRQEDAAYNCEACGRGFITRPGLLSHIRAHDSIDGRGRRRADGHL